MEYLFWEVVFLNICKVEVKDIDRLNFLNIEILCVEFM